MPCKVSVLKKNDQLANSGYLAFKSVLLIMGKTKAVTSA